MKKILILSLALAIHTTMLHTMSRVDDAVASWQQKIDQHIAKKTITLETLNLAYSIDIAGITKKSQVPDLVKFGLQLHIDQIKSTNTTEHPALINKMEILCIEYFFNSFDIDTKQHIAQLLSDASQPYPAIKENYALHEIIQQYGD